MGCLGIFFEHTMRRDFSFLIDHKRIRILNDLQRARQQAEGSALGGRGKIDQQRISQIPLVDIRIDVGKLGAGRVDADDDDARLGVVLAESLAVDHVGPADTVAEVEHHDLA